MGEFFDIHTHIIYDIDDGARNIEESIAMIKQDFDEGARGIIATPHYDVERPTDASEIKEKLESIKERIEGQTYSVPLYAGHEVLYFDGMIDRLDSGEILTLAGSRYVLIEFYTNETYAGIQKATSHLLRSGYIPIIAHAERFGAIRKMGVGELVDSGVKVQLSSSAFAGGMFDPIAKFCHSVMKGGEADFVGSDMHRMDKRVPKAKRCISWCKKNLDSEYASDVLYQNVFRDIIDSHS